MYDDANEPCPCGCGKTRDQAIRSMMRGVMALNYEQADALLSERFPRGSTDVRE